MYDTICAVKQSMLISSLLSAAIVGVVGDFAFCPDAWAEYAPENASREERLHASDILSYEEDRAH